MGVAGGDGGCPGVADGGAGDSTEGGGDEPGFRLRYLIQCKPVPGMLNEMYRCPVGETPYRRPGIPQLHLMPRLDNVQRNGPRLNALRNLHTMSHHLTLSSNQRTPASGNS